jgi:hypothetical protein
MNIKTLVASTALVCLSAPTWAGQGYDKSMGVPPTPPVITVPSGGVGGAGGIGGAGGTGGIGGTGGAGGSGGHSASTSAATSAAISNANSNATVSITNYGRGSGAGGRNGGIGSNRVAGNNGTDNGSSNGGGNRGAGSDGMVGNRGSGSTGGLGNNGEGGNNVTANAPPGFALPSFGGGQCATVGFGIAVSPSGGGAFGPAWESTNCRNYYIAVTLIQAGHVDQGMQLLAMITPEAATVINTKAPVQQANTQAPVNRPAWCDRAKPQTDASRDYVARECGQ